MSGENKSEEFDRKVEDFLWKNYKLSIKNKESLIEECGAFLDMTSEQIHQLKSEECKQISIRLTQYARYIQTSINVYTAKLTWAESNIIRSIANDVKSYTGYSYEERKNQAIMNNDYAKMMFDIKCQCQHRIDLLSYIANNVHKMTDYLMRF